jgi:hypothetical protein
VHEMMTNSAKYGALAASTGQVEVMGRLDSGASLVIDWKESGGPPVQPPSRRGFGTTIIERSVPFDLKGDAEIRFDLLGVQARFTIPANFVQMVPAMTGAPSRLSPKEGQAPRLSGTVLIVEDNLIIAMGAEVILLELGARHIDTAASVSQATEVDRAHGAELRAARYQPRRGEQSSCRTQVEGARRALHVRHRLWRARADSFRAIRCAGDSKAVYARAGREGAVEDELI